MLRIEGVFLALAVLSGFIWLMILLYWKQLQKKNQDMIYVSRTTVHTRWLHAAYVFFNDWFLTRYYIHKVRKQYEIMEPGKIKEIEEDTMKTAFQTWIICGGIILLSMAIEVSFYMAGVAVLTVYIASTLFLTLKINSMKMKLLYQLGEIMGAIEHNYYDSGMVDTAIHDSLNQAKHPVRIHMKKIHEILEEEEMDDEVEKYSQGAPNHFLKQFLSLCVNIVRYNDRMIEGIPLFVRSMSALKNDMDIEIRKMEKINHEFFGLSFVTVAPMYFLKIIENWFLKNMPQLEQFYKGAYGLISIAVIFIVTMAVYSKVNRMREMEYERADHHALLQSILNIPFAARIIEAAAGINEGRNMRINRDLRRLGETLTLEQFYVKRGLYCALGFCGGLLLVNAVHFSNKRMIVNYTYDLDKVIMTISADEEIVRIKKLIVDLTNQYKNQAPKDSVLLKEIRKTELLQNEELEIIAAREIQRRITRYQKEYFKWHELVLVCLAAYGCSWIPVLWLKQTDKLIEMEMENEVIQFQTIITMLMHIERIGTREILEQMEMFSVIFKGSITECINSFSGGELEALEILKEKENYEPFCRIVNNLMMADKSGVRKAFNEVEAERKSSQEKRKQDNAIYIEDKSQQAFLYAFIPSAAVLFLYVIVPCAIDVFSQFSTITSEISQF